MSRGQENVSVVRCEAKVLENGADDLENFLQSHASDDEHCSSISSMTESGIGAPKFRSIGLMREPDWGLDPIEEHNEPDEPKAEISSEVKQNVERFESLLAINSFTLRFENSAIQSRYFDANFKTFTPTMIFATFNISECAWCINCIVKSIALFRRKELPHSQFGLLVSTSVISIISSFCYLYFARDLLNERKSIAASATDFLTFKNQHFPSNHELSQSSQSVQLSQSPRTTKKSRFTVAGSVAAAVGFIQTLLFAIIRIGANGCNFGCMEGVPVLCVLRIWFFPALMCTVTSSTWITFILTDWLSKALLYYTVYKYADLDLATKNLFVVFLSALVLLYEILMYYLYLSHLNGFRQREVLMAMISEQEREAVFKLNWFFI